VLSRFSVGLGFRATGRERLFGRVDHAYRVTWRRGAGARVTMTGAREGMPALDGLPLNLEVTTFLPFIPGTDVLWAGGVLATADLPADALVHPFSANADTSYRFAVGDGVTFSLGNGRDIRVRELRVTPRRTDWRLVVGSFWVDEANGQLVRAAYRLAAPMTVRAVLGDSAYREIFADLPRWLVPLIEPVRASLDLLEVEYGLYEGIWLPRRQSATYSAQFSAFRLPMTHEERFTYNQIDVGLTVGGVASTAGDRDTTGRHRNRVRHRAAFGRRVARTGGRVRRFVARTPAAGNDSCRFRAPAASPLVSRNRSRVRPRRVAWGERPYRARGALRLWCAGALTHVARDPLLANGFAPVE
jgi:hypothetical protein